MNNKKTSSLNVNTNTRATDLTDSPKDKKALQPDYAVLDLPDVKDIPGQENIKVPPLGELADTTISSADEEGEGLFEDDDEDDDETDALKDIDELDNVDEIEGIEETSEGGEELLEDGDEQLLADDEDDEDEELLADDDEELLTDDDELLADDEDDDDELLTDDEDDEELLTEDDDDALLEDDDEEEGTSVGGATANADTKVTQIDKEMLENTTDYMPSDNELNLKRATLDNTDFDNEPLNEASFGEHRSGEDLDIANTEDDDENEAIGEEDEENNAYSLGGDEND